MDSLQSINLVIHNPKYKPLLVLLKAARNGAVYGTKIRFPHALVMILLFRSGDLRTKISKIIAATATHARSLATFAFTYKATMLILRKAAEATHAKYEESSFDSFLGGLVGGYIVFGRGIESPVNQQIVIYVFGRVVLGLAKLAMKKNLLVSEGSGHSITSNSWPVFATLSWGMVMWLFRWHPDVLQSSLRSSMVYLYDNAESWDSFRDLIIHNK